MKVSAVENYKNHTNLINFERKKDKQNQFQTPAHSSSNTIKAIPLAVLLAMTPLSAQPKNEALYNTQQPPATSNTQTKTIVIKKPDRSKYVNAVVVKDNTINEASETANNKSKTVNSTAAQQSSAASAASTNASSGTKQKYDFYPNLNGDYIGKDIYNFFITNSPKVLQKAIDNQAIILERIPLGDYSSLSLGELYVIKLKNGFDKPILMHLSYRAKAASRDKGLFSTTIMQVKKIKKEKDYACFESILLPEDELPMMYSMYGDSRTFTHVYNNATKEMAEPVCTNIEDNDYVHITDARTESTDGKEMKMLEQLLNKYDLYLKYEEE